MRALPFLNVPLNPSLSPSLRAVALDATVLAARMVLYPTGVRQEQHPDGPTAPDDGDGSDSRTLPTEGRSHPPVLLLHGFIDNRSVFALLRRSLHRRGWHQVHARNHSPLTWDIRAAAEHLGHHITELCERTGHRQIDIVGHSLGGLIARYYVQCLGGSDRIRALVTLGTPHSGTRAVPALSLHPIVRQLRPHSPLIAELTRPAPACDTRFFSFWSDTDPVIIPRASARIDHPDLSARNVLMRGLGHLTLPFHHGVATRIGEELAGIGQASAMTSASVA